MISRSARCTPLSQFASSRVSAEMARLCASDAFTTQSVHAAGGVASPATLFVLPRAEPLACDLLLPFIPQHAACNVFGTMHGGCIMTVADATSSLHASLLRMMRMSELDLARAADAAAVVTVAARARFHNAVHRGSPIVCWSTLVRESASSEATFDVRFVDAAVTPLRALDDGSWQVVSAAVDTDTPAAPRATFVSLTFTKA
jgi:acyl-coenzyme A thioesterase PaaI-like protein